MKIRLMTLLASFLAPALALATNGVGVMELHPYVTGRDFPWVVPFVGLLMLGVYLVRTLIAYRAADQLEAH